MPTSARLEVAISPKISVKSGASCGRTESSAPTGESAGRCRGRRLCRPAGQLRICRRFPKKQSILPGQCGHRPLQPVRANLLCISIKIYSRPSVLGREHASWCHPNSEVVERFPPAQGYGLRGPGDFGAVRLIRLLGGCPSRCCCKGLSASWPSLWAGRKPVLLPRRRKNQNYRIVFLFFIIMRQSRSPRCNPRISISAEARFVAHGTLDESHRRSVRMMR